MICAPLRTRLQLWLRDYDKLQSSAVILIYIQIGCALVGSLGALYNGVLLINLAIALFALVAIESGSQRLGRTYAILLIGAILLDIIWFILFSYEIWHISTEDYGVFFIFSVKLALSMQIIAFAVRFSSSFLWMLMYRLGASHEQSALSQETDYDIRTSFLNTATPVITGRTSDVETQLGGSIYHPAHYSSLFEPVHDNRYSSEGGGSDSSNIENILKLSLESHFGTKKDYKYKALEGDIQQSVDNEQHFHEQADPSTIASSSSAAQDCKYKALEGDNQHSVDNEQHFPEQGDPSTIVSSSSCPENILKLSLDSHFGTKKDCKYKALEGDIQHSVDNEQHFHEQGDPSTIASSSSAAQVP